MSGLVLLLAASPHAGARPVLGAVLGALLCVASGLALSQALRGLGPTQPPRRKTPPIAPAEQAPRRRRRPCQPIPLGTVGKELPMVLSLRHRVSQVPR